MNRTIATLLASALSLALLSGCMAPKNGGPAVQGTGWQSSDGGGGGGGGGGSGY